LRLLSSYRRLGFHLLAGLLTPAIGHGDIRVAVDSGVQICLPEAAIVEGLESAPNWRAQRPISSLLADRGSIVIDLVDKSATLAIGISKDARYVRHVNAMGRIEWLTFQAQMLAAQMQDIRQRTTDSVVVSSADRLADRDRVMISRAAWHQGSDLYNELIFDVFHETELIGFKFEWVGSEGGQAEKLIDRVLTSIEFSAKGFVCPE
jgi:hypothetical protein